MNIYAITIRTELKAKLRSMPVPAVFNAFSVLPAPKDLDMTDAEPIPTIIPTAIIISCMGSTMVRAVIPRGPTPLPTKSVSTML